MHERRLRNSICAVRFLGVAVCGLQKARVIAMIHKNVGFADGTSHLFRRDSDGRRRGVNHCRTHRNVLQRMHTRATCVSCIVLYYVFFGPNVVTGRTCRLFATSETNRDETPGKLAINTRRGWMDNNIMLQELFWTAATAQRPCFGVSFVHIFSAAMCASP